MSTTTGDGVPSHPTQSVAGPKHLQEDTVARVLEYERYLCRHLPSHQIMHAQALFRALLRMVECDAQLAQMRIDQMSTAQLLGNLKVILGTDNGSAQSVSANTIIK